MDAPATLALTLAAAYSAALALTLFLRVLVPRMRRPIFVMGTSDPDRVTLIMPGGTQHYRITVRKARRIARQSLRRIVASA